jgi:hypothetical protein
VGVGLSGSAVAVVRLECQREGRGRGRGMSEGMVLRALDGANPLGFLAALGASLARNPPAGSFERSQRSS